MMGNHEYVYVKPVKKKKKMEFSQKIVATAFSLSGFIVILTLGANFLLLWVGKTPMTQETISTITTYGGITSGLAFAAYSALTAWRNWSLDRYCKGKLDTTEGSEKNGN